MEKYFIPIASKVGAQRHLVAIRDAFLIIMPLMIIGALLVMLNNLPIEPFQHFMDNLFGTSTTIDADGAQVIVSHWKGFGEGVWNGTFAIMSTLISFCLPYNLIKSYNGNAIAAGTVSTGSFFALGAATSGLGSAGLFISIIVGISSAEIFYRLSQSSKLTIKMPEGVPPAVSKAFESMLPGMITICIFGLIAGIFAGLGVSDICASFYDLVQKPFMKLTNSYGSALLISFIAPFLWFFGLHGANMIDPFMQTINAPAIEENLSALKNGLEIPHIVNKPFFDSFVNMGGTGLTFGLVIAIYLVGRKNKANMVVNNLAVGPAFFNINEPLMFGLPIVLNPILFIPYILTPMVAVTIAYFATVIGLVPACTIMPPWVTPPIIGGIIATGSLAGGILALIIIVISVIIYIPFVSISNKVIQK
jgi:PTS system cellobiose-specific IIC component